MTRQHGSSGQQTQELFVYDVQTGVTSICTFGEDSSFPRQPQQHIWDSEHPLLLTCEMGGEDDNQHRDNSLVLPEVTLVTLFATPHGVVLQDSQTIKECQVRSSPVLHLHCPTMLLYSPAQHADVYLHTMVSKSHLPNVCHCKLSV